MSLYYGSQTHGTWAIDQHMGSGNFRRGSLWVLTEGYGQIRYGDDDTKKVWDRFKALQNRHSNYAQSGDSNNYQYQSLLCGSSKIDPQRMDNPLYTEAEELLKPNFIGYCGKTSKGKTWFMTVDGALFITKTYEPKDLHVFGFMPITREQQSILGTIEFAQEPRNKSTLGVVKQITTLINNGR